MRENWKYLAGSAMFRLIAIVLAVLLPLNLLTLILGAKVLSQVEERMGLEARHSLELYMSQADDAMLRASTALNYLSRNDNDFLRLAVKPAQDGAEEQRQIQAAIDFTQTLNDRIVENPQIDSFFAWFPEKEYFIQTSSGMHGRELGDLIRRRLEEPEGMALGSWSAVREGDVALVCYLAAYRGGYYGAWIELKHLASPLDFAGSWTLAFTDGAGEVLFSERDGLPRLDPEQSECVYRGERCMLLSVPSGCSSLRLARVMSRSEISGALPVAIRVLQILSVAALLVVPVVILSMQRWMVAPLRRLTDAMERIESGDLDYRIPGKARGSEFERINGSFNHMMDEVRDLKISLYDEQIKGEKIRIGFLAQQIRPHFILNALNILYSYEPEEFALAQRMILCLSRYFRYVVNANRDFVPLERELEHIQNYFEIQQARFRNTFRAEVRWESDTASLTVPPLLVQSFAENAIKHALTPGRTVDISVTASLTAEGKLMIRIGDTGPGIPEEVLERIGVFRQDHEFRPDLGVGIQNSIDRLWLLYRGEADLDIRRAEPHGTAVTLYLPARREEEETDECDIG
ncbi:MAG: histidine kinase [Oscillospiraceae bacterium]|nr:histidine kinase [Oscillospiraceae bacterium]